LNDNGEKQFHRTVSAILMAMKRLVPEFPIPYPFDIISSRRIVTIAAKTSWRIIRMALPAPITAISPYIPDQV